MGGHVAEKSGLIHVAKKSKCNIFCWFYLPLLWSWRLWWAVTAFSWEMTEKCVSLWSLPTWSVCNWGCLLNLEQEGLRHYAYCLIQNWLNSFSNVSQKLYKLDGNAQTFISHDSPMTQPGLIPARLKPWLINLDMSHACPILDQLVSHSLLGLDSCLTQSLFKTLKFTKT